MCDLQPPEIIEGGNALAVHWHDGRVSRFHAIWLRDNALDESTRSPSNGQRLITLSDIPTSTKISAAYIDNDELLVQFMPDNTTSRFASTWLDKNRYDLVNTQQTGWVSKSTSLWDSQLSLSAVTKEYDEITQSASSLKQWLLAVKQYGFAKLNKGPVENCALLGVAELFGYIRETNYGKWFEVRTEIKPTNLAYTGLGLQAHTDNPYRDPVPTLQILYCLENSAQGGENQVIDGFRAAQQLREQNPRGFELLSSHCARFEYGGIDDVHLQSRRPMIELAPDGELIGVRFNNRSASPITDVPFDLMSEFYAAYRQFGDIINDPHLAIEFKLEPGDCFIVDNTRVLHGRAAYSSDSGSRWLQGCYADKDSLLSCLSVLEQLEAANNA